MSDYNFFIDFDAEHFNCETDNEEVYNDFEVSPINEKIFSDGIDEYYRFVNEN